MLLEHRFLFALAISIVSVEDLGVVFEELYRHDTNAMRIRTEM